MDTPAYLNPLLFNQLLNQVGQAVAWRRAVACPCVSRDSGQPRVDCAQCFGAGHIWGEPTAAQAGVISGAQAQALEGFGLLDVGDVVLSIPSDSPLYAIGGYDRVQLCNRTEPFSLVLVAGLNGVDFVVAQVDSVVWLDSTDTLVSGSVPEVEGGRLRWQGLVPPDGVAYTLTGRRYPEYYCYQDQPVDRPHQFGASLPRRVALKRYGLLGR
ncbi:hypothetical protein KFZ76_19995 [Methylovulum psychrotolerans]|uniref:hypothetical protein n=1 Tax=Methylovulum psychrotolerans TaxID=1704499 RepID=UPI001BFF19D3|nr:hypothetical protein [Methylovulum psychrotolerans]MBT9099986.1 hypothetical protein [Methylovulum psychrotolerans]